MVDLGFAKLCTRLCLVVVAVFGVIRGIAYLPQVVGKDVPPVLNDLPLPLTMYAIAWLLAGLIALLGIPRPDPRATFLVVAMSGVWAVIYTINWIGSWQVSSHAVGPVTMWSIDGTNRDFLTANYYWTVALLLIGGRELAARVLAQRGSEG